MTALLHRLPDWPERLAAYLQTVRQRPFAWGTHDCVRFTAGAVQAVTGRDLLPAQWADAATAARLLRALGGLRGAVGTVLQPLPAPAFAQRGDVVLVRLPQADGRARRQCLAVADGARCWAPSQGGLVAIDAGLACAAWGVGHG